MTNAKTLNVAGKIIKRNGRIVESTVRTRATGAVGMPWGLSGMSQEFRENREIFPPAR